MGLRHGLLASFSLMALAASAGGTDVAAATGATGGRSTYEIGSGNGYTRAESQIRSS